VYSRHETQPFVAADPGDDAVALQANMAEHGHVFFSGALPAEPVLEARTGALVLLREASWVAPGGRYEARWTGVNPAPSGTDPEWLATLRRRRMPRTAAVATQRRSRAGWSSAA
jgi:hypothetical protein